MGLFKISKKKINYNVIKVYKIVDFNGAKRISTKDVVLRCLDLMFLAKPSYPDRFEINFGKKQWKSKKNFEAALIKMKNADLFDLTASFSDSKTSLYFDNNILNIEPSSIPSKSIASIEIAIPSTSVNYNNLISFFIELHTFFQYDYGYIVELTEDYDFGTERKIKKRLFGQEVTLKEIDKIWRFHSAGINHGYIKNVYPLNILNESQISQPEISKCIKENIGKIEKINDSISLWMLTNRELFRVQDRLKKSKYIIANEDSLEYFLESDESKQFYTIMKIG